mmetsp:Transcript_40281/g.101408  ORF Transcript_40281/g.101408 Transcript_40281/m.101408 type:complete len:424 (-) Transcript_40281:598-1869(-)
MAIPSYRTLGKENLSANHDFALPDLDFVPDPKSFQEIIAAKTSWGGNGRRCTEATTTPDRAKLKRASIFSGAERVPLSSKRKKGAERTPLPHPRGRLTTTADSELVTPRKFYRPHVAHNSTSNGSSTSSSGLYTPKISRDCIALVTPCRRTTRHVGRSYGTQTPLVGKYASPKQSHLRDDDHVPQLGIPDVCKKLNFDRSAKATTSTPLSQRRQTTAPDTLLSPLPRPHITPESLRVFSDAAACKTPSPPATSTNTLPEVQERLRREVTDVRARQRTVAGSVLDCGDIDEWNEKQLKNKIALKEREVALQNELYNNLHNSLIDLSTRLSAKTKELEEAEVLVRRLKAETEHLQVEVTQVEEEQRRVCTDQRWNDEELRRMRNLQMGSFISRQCRARRAGNQLNSVCFQTTQDSFSLSLQLYLS